ncbi:MAG: hypothetical protein RLZZ428_595 [Pseudomonadota bacterium]|jgi:hypothetical protein
MDKLLLKLSCASLVAVVLSGCVKPEFDPYNQGIVFIEGKPYLIPYDSAYRLINDTKGVICNLGEVRWIEPNTVRTSSEYQKEVTLRIGNKYGNVTTEQSDAELSEALKSYERDLMTKGLVGCVAPMSNREYEYYRDQED